MVEDKEKIYYFIINHDRLDVLKKEIDSLRFHKSDIEKLVIVDHNTSYEPVLNYYENMKDDEWIDIIMKKDQYYKVENVTEVNLARVGFRHLLDVIKDYQKKYGFKYFAKCDPDCEIPPVNNYFQHLIKICKHFDNKYQVGAALRLDDIPDEYPMKEKTLEWEARFWAKHIENKLVLDDHEYMLYMPEAIDNTLSIFHYHYLETLTEFFCFSSYFPAIRVAGEFQIRHLDWYITKPSEELYFYRKTSGTKASHSTNWILGLKEFECKDEEIIDKIKEIN